MKVEIWSDIVCPFCYIGKRRFEAALEQFEHKDDVEVIYRSFELDPNAKRDNQFDMHSLLASKYGMSREQAKSMNDQVANQAKEVGLTYHFDNMIPTNSFDAHRLIHFSAQHGKALDMLERLYKAYFTDSKHIGDRKTLSELAADIGLDKKAVAEFLTGEGLSREVLADEQEAHSLGINAVPFFVINRKYGISGAQPSEVFLGALQQAWNENN